jgi:hypothetical protein
MTTGALRSELPWQVSAKVAGSGAKSCATSSCTSQLKQTQDLLQAALRTYIPAFMCRKRGQTSRRSLLQAARRTRCTADGPAPLHLEPPMPWCSAISPPSHVSWPSWVVCCSSNNKNKNNHNMLFSLWAQPLSFRTQPAACVHFPPAPQRFLWELGCCCCHCTLPAFHSASLLLLGNSDL